MSEDKLPPSLDILAQVDAIRNNDEKSLEALYLANYRKVEDYVLKNNGNTDDAKDVFQEAFIATWRNVQTGRFVPVAGIPLDAYLIRLAKNKWIDHLRSAGFKKVVALPEDGLEHLADGTLDEQQSQKLAIIKEHFKAIGDNCRDLLTRFYYHKNSLRKISEHFGWTEATARNNKYRCIEKLRTLMKNRKH